MFWKKNKTVSNVDQWKMLQWWRTPQEYIPWTSVDLKEPFKELFQNEEQQTFVEFDDEASLVSTVWELRSIFEQLLKKAEVDKRDELSKLGLQLQLKTAQVGREKFVVRPFMLVSPSLDFWPPKQIETDVHLTLAFLNPETAKNEMEKRLQYWETLIHAEHIDQFVYRQAVYMFRQLLIVQAKKTDFDALIDIWDQFESFVLDQQSMSQEYLKKVWRIPLFIFANQPEQAAFTRLLLQKSFQAQLPRLKKECERLYWAQLLQWQLFRQFDSNELHSLAKLVRESENQRAFITGELFVFYSHLLKKCGVPIEYVGVYGTEPYVKRVTSIFSKFPKAAEDFPNLVGGTLYTLLLAESIRFTLRNAQKMSAKPEELLRALIGIMVRRLAQFQDRHNVSLQE